MGSKVIIYRYGRPSTFTVLGMGLLFSCVFFMLLPILLVVFVSFGISTAYMTWRLKRILDAYARERCRQVRFAGGGAADPCDDPADAIVIDITPEDRSSARDLPAVLSRRS